MGIADFFRPKHRHSDVRVRAEAVRALGADDAATLIEIARTDRDAGVRRLAIEKITIADALAELAAAEPDRAVRDLAGERAAQLWLTAACGDDAERAGAALTGIVKLGDQHALVEVAARGGVPAVRKRAFSELRDARALAELAKRDAPQEVRTAAVARIDDPDVLRALAVDATAKEVGLAAVERLDDVERLEQIAHKAKHKAVRQKARKIVAEIAEAERAKQPGVPDEVKRRRAERAQLVREVEGAADSFDFARVAGVVQRAQAAWRELLGGAEGADPSDADHASRFERAVERFWRRKELHDSQARSAEELRAVEREAAAEKLRAAAERAAAAEAPADRDGDVVRPTETPDPKREAREAEARAHREERERKRAEEDARRQAQAAERAAKAKEDAERGVAVAASLGAMAADMEQLAGAATAAGREIDRVLAQAAKAFEAIGKVPAAERDAVAERYRAARARLAARAAELREAEDWQRFQNVPKAEALIATAKQLLESPATPDLGNRLRGLQALWKEVGPMPQRRSKELWEQFKAACDQLYEKVRGVRAVEQERFGEVAKVKEALIAEAEALSESTDWVATADKLKALQQQWKASGHLPRKQGDELWTRFRAACDRFFARRKPVLDAQHEEQAASLRAKQALIARAQAIAAAAPGEGGWGKAIGAIKDLQQEWNAIGYVPRRDADAVYKAFRAACDSVFEQRSAARDAEANAHRAELDAIRAELAAIHEAIAAPAVAGDADPGPALAARVLAVRERAREQRDLASQIDDAVRALAAAHPGALRGTELDPAQLRGRREKLIARAEGLIPKAAPPAAPASDGAALASQLKAAMRQNAFGDLRFSGRDPLEVVDELRASWAEAGPILDAEDRAQAERFEAVLRLVAPRRGGAAAEPEVGGADVGRPAGPPLAPLAGAEASGAATAALGVAHAIHDAITRPAHVPPGLPDLPDPPAASDAARDAAARGARARTPTDAPPAGPLAEDLDTGWDLGDDDPTAGAAEERPGVSPPGAAELAGDGVVDGDGLDQVD
jgi:hypothetical protein